MHDSLSPAATASNLTTSSHPVSHRPYAASSVEKALGGLLAGPVLPALLKLAAPTLVVLVVQTFVSIIETY